MLLTAMLGAALAAASLDVAPGKCALCLVPQSRRDRMRDLLFFLPSGRRRELAADMRAKSQPVSSRG